MDRTLILHTSVIHTSKKTVEAPKLTESFLCDEIHDNLRTLALLQPFSDDFKETFEKGMFIKPNAKAFPHVLKYLFMICDPNDFKKKFPWPIYNKAAEATFRNASLELLNKLNVKYELGFGEVKNKILVFPGGMEFMRVIYELTRLSMQLVLKRNGVNDPDSQKEISLSAAKKQLDDLEDLCTFVMDFKKKVEKLSPQFKAKTEILNELLKKCVAKTNITPKMILEDKFTDGWEEVHNEIVERGILPDVERLTRFQTNCDQLEQSICAMFKQKTLTINQTALAAFSSEMQKQYPHKFQQMATIITNGTINLDHMLQALPLILPTQLHLIESYKPRNTDAMAYESHRLRNLSQKTDDLLQKTLQLSDMCHMTEKEPDFHVAPQFKNIQSMILSTPTISYDAVRRAEGAIQSKRLSLLEDAHHLRPAASTMNLVPRALNSILEDSNGAKLFLSPTRVRSKEPKTKLDPMAILNTIKKKEKKDKYGHFKAKHNNVGLRYVIANNQLENSKNDANLSVPDFSSTLLNHSVEVKEHHCSVNDQINTSLAKIIGKSVIDESKRRSLLVESFEHTECDINSSPSGRIESLVTSQLNVSEIKPTNLFDKQSENQSMNVLTALEPKSNVSGFGRSRNFNISDIENNQNAPNKNAFNLNSMIDENDESLLNISDRILNSFNDTVLT